jgi:hypothetical protein
MHLNPFLWLAGQWVATVWLRNSTHPTFFQHKCNATAWGGACNQQNLITQKVGFGIA